MTAVARRKSGSSRTPRKVAAKRTAAKKATTKKMPAKKAALRKARRTHVTSGAINLRIHDDDRILVDRAAETLGMTRTEFMLSAARKEAENALLNRHLRICTDDRVESFIKRLDEPADTQSLRRLKATLARQAPWEN